MLLAVVALWISLAPAKALDDPSTLLSRALEPTLDVAGAVTLRDVELPLGPGRFRVDRGVLFPARIEDGRVVELVFIGQARFLLEAPDEIEANQLELFTGDGSLDAPVEEAVLALPPARADELLRRPAPREVRPELADRAREIWQRWMGGAERKYVGVAVDTFAGLAGDAAYADYFTLWCRSFELGTFVFHRDPDDPEPVTLASFHPARVDGWDKQRLRREIRLHQRKGRWLGLRYEDLGAWDVWLSSKDTTGPAGGSGFEAEHYEIDVTIERDSRRLAGRARVHASARESGRRLIRFELMNDLVVDSVTDARGRNVFHVRSGAELLVLLPESTVAGDKHVLTIEYGGNALEWVDRRTWNLLDTSNWHPHCGEVDRATYDVTLRWPRKHELLASGTLVDRGSDGSYVWERRRIDIPSMAFSFALGRFLVDRRRVGHVDLTVAFDRNMEVSPTPELRAAVIDRLADALSYYEQVFGPYPLDELTVVTAKRDYSQSYLGLVVLSNTVLRYLTPQGDPWLRDLVIAHELAHQWWGNLVGWRSYRDQWLSEGMANYAALLYSSRRAGGREDLLGEMSAGWRRFLSQRTADGRTLESLGPVVLGVRLNSTRAENGYRSIVYRKGAVVLAMLARVVGEERFLELLRTLAVENAHGVLTTEDFLDTIAARSAIDLDGFARQYVFGTGIPHVYYTYSVAPGAKEGWVVRGAVRVLPHGRLHHEIVDMGQGRWDVARRLDDVQGPEALIVPYRVTRAHDDTAEELEAEEWTAELEQAAQLEEGRVFVSGPEDDFVLETKWKPRDLQLDPGGEILAWFHSRDRTPRAFYMYHAEDLVYRGQFAEAEDAYLAALSLPPDEAGPEADPLRALGRAATDFEGVRIRFALARLCLDQGRDSEAQDWLDQVENVLGKDDPTYRLERDVLRSRFDLRRGDAGVAHHRLERTLSLAYPTRGNTPTNQLWRARFGASGPVLADAFGLFAAAATAVGDDEGRSWALREAMQRGVDVSAL